MARAMRAYFVASKKVVGLGVSQQPSSSSSAVEQYGGKVYVSLRNANGIVAVYRVRNDGMLKRLRRWPKGIEE